MTHYLVRAQHRAEERRKQQEATAHALSLFIADAWDDTELDDADGRTFQWWTTGGSALG